MKKSLFVLLMLGVNVVTGCAATKSPPPKAVAQHRIAIREYLGYAWPSAVLHRVIQPQRGKLFPGRLTFLAETAPSGGTGRAIPFQLRNSALYPDGSLKRAEIWFRSDLPANVARTFLIRATAKAVSTPASDLRIEERDDVTEISNSQTSVRLPAVGKSTPAATGGTLPGPLLGVRLKSGQWTAASKVLLPDGATLIERDTKVLEQGPIITRANVAYRFSNGGKYSCDVELRQGEAFVRVDERYDNAGKLSLDLGAGLEPTKFATKKHYSGEMQLTPIAPDKTTCLPSLTGWDFYLADRTALMGLLGGPRDDLLAWISTSADWLPKPYSQTLSLTAEPGSNIVAQGPLEFGHRHWGLLVGKGSDFPDTGRNLYHWWTKNVVVPLDKAANWQLVWPGMDKIEFPHTFFSKAELPAIRARLQAEPVIKEYMEDLRERRANWSPGPDWTPEKVQAFDQMRAKYESRRAITKGISYVGAAALYFNDPVYYDQLKDPLAFGDLKSPLRYADEFVKLYMEGTGPMDSPEPTGGAAAVMGSMNVSDALLQRYVGAELLLGSGVLTPEEKRKFLSQLAFMTYVMHEEEWQPRVHMADGSVPEGYGQGTPNQKHCAFTARAITACMLANHPMKQEWMKFAMAEVRAHYPWTINESGALLESPFYSSRDTLRYAPFWSAMTRAGVDEIAPDYKQWMNRPKKAFQYLADMLTPKEPRMDGRRVYHPIGRSGPGVVDPTFMIGGDPWGLDDPQHASLMRWAWEQQGKPSPDVMGTTGGRDLSLTLIAFSHPAKPLQNNPLHSRRYEGMGAVFRSNPESDYESNVLWRHDGFCWDLYAVNNGAVYFYGKGAPLLPRFGAYWSHSYGGASMMDLPFGNRVEFASGNNNCFGSTTEFAALGNIADLVGGITDDKHWTRTVLFSKDLDKDDPVYLLVRDDVNRPDTPSFLNWWFMTKNVAPDGIKALGVVSMKIPQEEWIKNLGHNWKDAPKLTGQLQHFPGMTGVDVDLFIASPTNPQIVTDAASAGNFPYNIAGQGMFETQQLVRISQPSEKGYLSLITPRWPGSEQPKYRTIADGNGVAITRSGGEGRLFLADRTISYQDETVDFRARAGFYRSDRSTQRLMVQSGKISGGGITLSTPNSASLVVADGKVQVFHSGEQKDVEVALPERFKAFPISYAKAESFSTSGVPVERKSTVAFTFGEFEGGGKKQNYYSAGQGTATYSAGYRFHLTETIHVTHLGVLDWKDATVAASGDGLNVAIYRGNGGAALATATVTRDDTTTSPAGKDGRDPTVNSSFRYHALPEPVTLEPGTYVIISETVKGEAVGNTTGAVAFSEKIVPAAGLGLTFLRPWMKAGVSSSEYFADPVQDTTPGYFGPNFIAAR
jgi:hypothetical protein